MDILTLHIFQGKLLLLYWTNGEYLISKRLYYRFKKTKQVYHKFRYNFFNDFEFSQKNIGNSHKWLTSNHICLCIYLAFSIINTIFTQLLLKTDKINNLLIKRIGQKSKKKIKIVYEVTPFSILYILYGYEASSNYEVRYLNDTSHMFL